jgi:hypothetical protein
MHERNEEMSFVVCVSTDSLTMISFVRELIRVNNNKVTTISIYLTVVLHETNYIICFKWFMILHYVTRLSKRFGIRMLWL